MTRTNPRIEEQGWAREASTVHSATVRFSGNHDGCDKTHIKEHCPKIELINRPFEENEVVAGKEIGYSTPKAPRKLKKLMKTVKRFKIFGSKDAPDVRGCPSDVTKMTVDLVASSEEMDSKSDTRCAGIRRVTNTNTAEIRCNPENLDANSRCTNLNMKCERGENQLDPAQKACTVDTRDTFKWDSPKRSRILRIDSREASDPYALGKSRGSRQSDHDVRILDTKIVNTNLGKLRQKVKQQLPKDIHGGFEGDEAKTTVSVLTMTSPITAGEKKHFSDGKPGDGCKKEKIICRHETYDSQDLPQHFCHTYGPNPQVENAMRLLGLDTMTVTDDSSGSNSGSSESGHEKLDIEHVHINSINRLQSTSNLTSSSDDYSDSDLSSVATNDRRAERLHPFRSALTMLQGRIADCLTPILDSPPTHYERRHVFREKEGRCDM